MTASAIKDLIDRALSEDIGDGDHSSLSCIPHGVTGKARLIIKEKGIIAGVEIARTVFASVDPDISFNPLVTDGSAVNPGDIGFTVEGSVHSLLKAERLSLNFLQRMSGIATTTRAYVDKLRGTGARVLDTRKTTPGMRLIEKEAVRIGGGMNHRMGLYDMIMLKDNHVDFAGGIKNAIDRANRYLETTGRKLKIEIEARSLGDVQEIMTCGGVDRIMLDNFSIADTAKAVKIIAGRYETESSGGITIENIGDYAACGVDFISVGALTHHIKSLDMSLKAYE